MATSPHSLPTKTACRLYKAASQGQLGKAWRQLRALPPVFVVPDQWNETFIKFTPHERQEGPLSERTSPQNNGFPLLGSATNHFEFKKNKAADAGGWTIETAQSCLSHPCLKQTLLQWIHGQAVTTQGPARRRGLWRTHRLVCLDEGGGAIRPILIGMLWSKILSQLFLKPAKSDLEVFVLRAHLADNPSHVVP